MDNAITELIEVLTESTRVPAFYINSNNTSSPAIIKGIDFAQATKYLDFIEILNFLEKMFERNNINTNTYHTYYTYNSFAYNIVFRGVQNKLKGAVISGPILINPPDKKLLKQFLISKNLTPNEKNQLISTFESLTIASMKRIDHLGRLLYFASRNDEKVSLSSISQEIHNNQNMYKKLINRAFEDTYFYTESDDDYIVNFKLLVSIKKEIAHGNADRINEIVYKYIKLFTDTDTVKNNCSKLKNKCIVICSSSCIYALQENALYNRVIPILKNFITKLETQSSSDEIISHMITTIQNFAYEVSANAKDNYSLHVNQIIQYLKNHFAEKITLNQLSKYFNLSPVYISSLINKETKISLTDHINKIRIDESKKLLIYTNKSMYDIAYEVGFLYQNHFNSIFKKLVGITPLEFRRVNSKNNYISE